MEEDCGLLHAIKKENIEKKFWGCEKIIDQTVVL